MKRALIFTASLSLGLLSTQAYATGPTGSPLEATDGSYQVAGITWACGKNNPAWWGSPGNGCLKQKRAAKKKGSASMGSGSFAVEQPAPPPPPLPLPLKN